MIASTSNAAGGFFALRGEQGPDGHLVMMARIRSAAALGRAYLKSEPREADARELVGLLRASGVDVNGDESGPDLVRRIRMAGIAESDRNDVAWVGGWAMSRAEARLCALVAKTTPSGALNLPVQPG